MLSKKESCLVIAICYISVDSPSTVEGWRLIKQAHISLGTLHKKSKAFKDPPRTTWEPGGWKLEERNGREDDASD